MTNNDGLSYSAVVLFICAHINEVSKRKGLRDIWGGGEPTCFVFASPLLHVQPFQQDSATEEAASIFGRLGAEGRLWADGQLGADGRLGAEDREVIIIIIIIITSGEIGWVGLVIPLCGAATTVTPLDGTPSYHTPRTSWLRGSGFGFCAGPQTFVRSVRRLNG